MGEPDLHFKTEHVRTVQTAALIKKKKKKGDCKVVSLYITMQLIKTNKEMFQELTILKT